MEGGVVRHGPCSLVGRAGSAVDPLARIPAPSPVRCAAAAWCGAAAARRFKHSGSWSGVLYFEICRFLRRWHDSRAFPCRGGSGLREPRSAPRCRPALFVWNCAALGDSMLLVTSVSGAGEGLAAARVVSFCIATPRKQDKASPFLFHWLDEKETAMAAEKGTRFCSRRDGGSPPSYATIAGC